MRDANYYQNEIIFFFFYLGGEQIKELDNSTWKSCGGKKFSYITLIGVGTNFIEGQLYQNYI